MVTIQGEVIRPGDYPLEKGMTVKALINMAGGFMRSAYLESADLASYEIQNASRVLTKHQPIELDKALQGDKSANVALKPGDVLSVRQLTGWNDIGSSVTVNGEIGHPGVYGIAEGERLSSVLKRAGGFRGSSFPPGAVLERVQVRETQEKSRQNLIQRIQSQDLTSMSVSGSTTPQEQTQMLQTIHQQQQQALAALQRQPASGRLVIRISDDISSWENTPADIEMRQGDVLTIPKRAAFVAVNGQVYSPSALTYLPGKTAGWYLEHAGGATNMGDKKNIFIVRADGSVIGRRGKLEGSVLSIHLNPGDSVVVPEKIVGSPLWKSLLTMTQMLSATALTAAVAAGI
jgi:protein involved in polysaccharide export with SLBB domain